MHICMLVYIMPNTLGLSFSNRFSHVEMRKRKNF